MSTGFNVFWRRVFRVKGLWNCAASVGFLLWDDALRDLLHVPHPDPVYRAMFLSLAFTFGLGYWWVSRDLDKNHGIVRMGILGQLAVFVVLAYAVGFAPQRLPWILFVPGVIDALFAVAFMIFLWQYPRRGGAISA